MAGLSCICWPFLIWILTVISLSVSQTLKEVGQIHAPHAAFASLVHKDYLTDPRTRTTLVISGFNPIPLLHDTIYQVGDIGQHLANLRQASVTEVTQDVTWPNEVSQVPKQVFNSSSYVIAAGGFLVPLKNHGSLTLFNLALDPPTHHAVTGSGEDSQWFYHRVQWLDVDGDGLLDIVTCRAIKHLLGGAEGQLVWFKHPQQNALSTTWQSHVIATHNADIFFDVTTLPTPAGDVSCIIAAGFFTHTLAVFWTEDPRGRWNDNTKIHSRVIDSTIGAVFDVKVADLNADGTLDLLVTNNALSNASIFAYTVPTDFRTGHFERRTLSTGYSSRTQGQGHGAPGSPVLVYPRTDDVTHGRKKPWILLSGDDDGRAYLLRPTSSVPGDWAYQQATFLDVGTSTVGGLAAGDVDGDGYNEVFAPSFGEGFVHVFTFRP